MRRRILRNKLIWAGGSVVVLLVLMAITAPLLTPYDPATQDLTRRLLVPGQSGHPLGTDDFGRDLWARIVYGSRISIQVAAGSVVVALLLGSSLGLVSGYFVGRADLILDRLNDILMAFPPLVLALMIVAVRGPSLTNASFAIGITLVPRFYRVLRGSVLVARERGFVLAARAMGSGDIRLMLRHIVPNVLSPVLVVASLSIGSAILIEAELSFLGLGVPPPAPSWGSIVSNGKEYIDNAPWVSALGGLAVMIAVLGSNLLGDGLRDVLDPKLKT